MGGQTASSQHAFRRPFIITFSGIDGAGKTTQIENLAAFLEKRGLRVARLSFWDDVAMWSNFRAGVGGRSVEHPEVAIEDRQLVQPRNNKHVRKWYLTVARSGMYVLDVARLRHLLANEPLKDFDVIIFDRYVYDQIANIDSQSSAAQTYAKLLLKRTPVPDLAFIVDTSPDAAFHRKPEYPLEFVHKNRQSFLRLKEIAPSLIIVPEGSPEEVEETIHQSLAKSSLIGSISIEMSSSTTDTVVPKQTSCRVQNQPTTGG